MHPRHRNRSLLVLAVVGAGLAVPGVAQGHDDQREPTEARLLASGLGGGSGSTIGPDGDLYVTEPTAGEVSRIDRRTGEVTVVATCLPLRGAAATAGGAMDVAFLDDTMYVLVGLVADAVTGVYRVDDEDTCTVVADTGAFSRANPPPVGGEAPGGVPYAMQPFRGGFLITDGNHNRVLRADPDGDVRSVLQLGNVVPTGLDGEGRRVHLALAGPVPHRPEDGRIVSFRVGSDRVRDVASGGRLLVDVEFGRHAEYALSQGAFPAGGTPATPAVPDTGQLLRVDDGGFDVVAEPLDRPTSLEVTRGAAYIVTYDGEVWRVDLS
ncbi:MULTISPECIES: ScyD/ScyE family protein [unclassified Geodermatophilus]|uniref:ScyD/ScyE family protein n=1 Tax=unclassified Geodermatophilus TaxID=2637632 RepID=UPI003EEEA8DB